MPKIVEAGAYQPQWQFRSLEPADIAHVTRRRLIAVLQTTHSAIRTVALSPLLRRFPSLLNISHRLGRVRVTHLCIERVPGSTNLLCGENEVLRQPVGELLRPRFQGFDSAAVQRHGSARPRLRLIFAEL